MMKACRTGTPANVLVRTSVEGLCSTESPREILDTAGSPGSANTILDSAVKPSGPTSDLILSTKYFIAES